MSLQTQDFQTIVRNMVTAMQANNSNLVNFTAGSVLRSIVEAGASVVLWLQAMVLQLLLVTRAATSSGADLDSFVADYGLTRSAAVKSTGVVSFSRFTPTNQSIIAVGTQVQTADTTQAFSVMADTTQPLFNASLNSYVIPAGQASGNVTVQAVNAGIQGNVAASTITLLSSSIPGVDTVNNAANFTNGIDTESDTALRARFVLYIKSLSKTTKDAIAFAITSVAANIVYSLTENQTYAGSNQNGFFYIVADDGSGAIPQATLDRIFTAVDVVRAFGTQFTVHAAVRQNANVVMTVVAAAGYSHSDIATIVQAAITAYINSLSVGETLFYNKLAQVAYDSTIGIGNVTALTLNGGITDFTAIAKNVIRPGTITVN